MRKRLTMVGGVLLLIVIVPVGALYWFYESNFARVQGEFFDSDGLRIHYTDVGEGEPVILVHGFAFNADLNWRSPGVIDALKDSYRVIAIDNRGHGLSDKPHDVAAYGENMPRDIIRLMDHLKIDKAHVVGYSMGGFITLKLTTMHPERLLSAAPCGMGWGQVDAETSDLIERIATSLEQGNGFAPLLERLNIDASRGGLVGSLFNKMLTSTNDTLALAKVMRAMPNLAVTEEQLKANQVPVLSVVGSIDPLAENAEPLHDTMSNHELVYLDGADHVTALRHVGFLTALRAHLEAHPAGSWAYAEPQPATPETPVTVPVSEQETETTPAAEALPDAA